MADQAVLAEIARLEGELTRIRTELEALKRKVEGPVRRHTKAFTSRPPAPESMRVPDAPPPPSSVPAPSPSVPASSQTVPTSSRRRAPATNVGLSDFPPPPATQPNATPSRRSALGNPEAGRYEYVGDGRPTRKSR
ncbi:MAG: hypothetical protein ACXVEF_31265 [Polyangiales bacterium]